MLQKEQHLFIIKNLPQHAESSGISGRVNQGHPGSAGLFWVEFRLMEVLQVYITVIETPGRYAI